jgi:hypothetical protein
MHVYYIEERNNSWYEKVLVNHKENDLTNTSTSNICIMYIQASYT